VSPSFNKLSQDIYAKNDYPKIAITAQDVYEHRKEFMDIRHDHKNAHFQMGINPRSQSTTTLDR
jgi:hypothetical protein